MFPYHGRLKQLLRTEPYIVAKGEKPFAFRFIFTQLGKSIPIREHRVAEYREYIEGEVNG